MDIGLRWLEITNTVLGNTCAERSTIKHLELWLERPVLALELRLERPVLALQLWLRCVERYVAVKLRLRRGERCVTVLALKLRLLAES